jgi:hypothetical protein
MGKIVSSTLGRPGMVPKPPVTVTPKPRTSPPVPKPVSTGMGSRPGGAGKPALTGIAKARSVGGNAYAKGQTRKPARKAVRMGRRKF